MDSKNETYDPYFAFLKCNEAAIWALRPPAELPAPSLRTALNISFSTQETGGRDPRRVSVTCDAETRRGESVSDDDPPYQPSGDVMRLQIPISKAISGTP